MQVVWVTFTAYGHMISEGNEPPEEGLFSIGPFRDFWDASKFIDWQEVTANWN